MKSKIFKLVSGVFGLFSLIFLGCEISPDLGKIIDDEKNIRFILNDGLNDDPKFKLKKDANGFYYFNLINPNQNIQRISVRLLDYCNVISTKCCGKRQKID
ncbi:hypothetical protein EOJ36_03875 [Sandaracinomonas limnophila]|uniref:Lipoprotein n=1 Tax=Sandaracinomonas limnophila TaxID=1862386 RepID=A0A437PTG9_9BACT|nr:hypothetical protein [Sandaracinomonas limnophila]RVU25565.1 hypothetical protein EOJ36_03875 [Sandaracinomonas limnophila]